MKITYEITPAEVHVVRSFYKKWENDPFVQNRYHRNVAGQSVAINQSKVWEAVISCLLTSQQRSGPASAVNRFITRKPFPLRLKACRAHPNPAALTRDTIDSFGGIRRGETIGRQAAFNLQRLEENGWPDFLDCFTKLKSAPDRQAERQAARYVAEYLKGFGPKQSRNLLQSLGLTRYEIPIDSRITRWLNEFGFPVILTAQALSNTEYFEFVSDGFQAICEKAGIYPCLLDAAIFTSYDKGKWQPGNIRW